jgi:hypothetical protein
METQNEQIGFRWDIVFVYFSIKATANQFGVVDVTPDVTIKNHSIFNFHGANRSKPPTRWIHIQFESSKHGRTQKAVAGASPVAACLHCF